jgi:hypothetical protein
MARRLLQVRLTDEARAGWDKASTEEVATVTALLEAYGEALAADDKLPPKVVNRARAIDRERRSR